MIENDELNRVVGAKIAGVQEEVIERALRPRGFAEYVGQEKICEQLSIFIEATRKRGEALEDFQLDIMIGEGPAARSVKLDLPPFTLVGATTRAGMLTNPLRDRFGIVARLEFYNADELTRIVVRSAALLKISIEPDGAREI